MKSSGRDIQIDPLVDVAKRVRPNVVVLAVLEPDSPRLKEKLDRLQGALAGTDIAAELLTLRDGDFEDDVRLPG